LKQKVLKLFVQTNDTLTLEHGQMNHDRFDKSNDREVNMRFTASISIGLYICLQIAFSSGVLANSNSDAIKLYNDKEYKEAQAIFEKESKATWDDSSAAYYYALTLNALGRTEDGLKVCKKIVKLFPQSKAAEQANKAIKLWSYTPLSADLDVGMLGLVFKISEDHLPFISRVLPGTSADKELGEDDVILAINGVKTENLDKEQIFRMLTGKPDTKVTLTLKRRGVTFNKSLTRMHSREFAIANPDIWKQYVTSLSTEKKEPPEK
jgi:tetratricopeptide (TPR) repeat protein